MRCGLWGNKFKYLVDLINESVLEECSLVERNGCYYSRYSSVYRMLFISYSFNEDCLITSQKLSLVHVHFILLQYSTAVIVKHRK